MGKVKTRIAQTLGEENALKIYKKLLIHTNVITENLPVDKYIFYSDYINKSDLWSANIYYKELQSGHNLGERMKKAFSLLFERKYAGIVIIGSDCHSLTSQLILSAFASLKLNDVVIGPAVDGGYYLLGMKHFFPQIFNGKKWSSDSVFNETIHQIKALNLRVSLLEILNDIDTEKDVTFGY